MASYKQPCLHCGTLIERDARFCVSCGSHSPFGYACPDCLKPIQKGDALCAGCGRSLFVPCPKCGKESFVAAACAHCGESFLLPCPNERCGKPQFFQAQKCTACGKKIKRK